MQDVIMCKLWHDAVNDGAVKRLEETDIFYLEGNKHKSWILTNCPWCGEELDECRINLELEPPDNDDDEIIYDKAKTDSLLLWEQTSEGDICESQ
jgi:hypothetical protein